ncbi:ankyrin [Fusarium tricinctum]|uniref:Ankyrin n=1 Tax=Fusarium tricinctum TaxID=61284 RepID=A0A8K0RS73_9HYPO|nr:ankyrin [Fusarium tricinctum]
MLRRKSATECIKDSFRGTESDYPLHNSICKNDLLTLQEVLSSPEASYLLTTGDGCWGTPLHVAIYLDSIEAVNLLLQAGVDVAADSSVHKQRLSPLALAASVGNQRLLWRLWSHLRSHSEVNNIQNVDSCLFQASINGQIPILRALLGWWAWTTEAKNEALFWAARSWKVYSAELLTSEVSFSQESLDKALGFAVDFKPLLGDEITIEYNGDDYLEQQLLIVHLVDAGADPNATIDRKPIILTAARHINLVGALKVLLEKGANPNATDHGGKTALHFLGSPAAIHQSGPVVRMNEIGVRLLLGHGASVLQGDDESGATPLHAAAFGASFNMLQLYLSSCPAEERRQTLGIKNKYGETLLHYAAAGAKCDIAEFLISQGLAVNGTNLNGWTPLHCALTLASQGSQLNGLSKSISDALKLAELLLSHGADPLAVTAEGWTPLHCLAIFASRKKNHTKLIQFVHDLAQRGVDIHGRATFIYWNELGDKEPKYYYWGHEVQESIRDTGSSGATVRFDYTALHFAAAHGSMSLAKALLELGADSLSEDARGNTVIKIATHSSLIDDFPGTRQAMVRLLTEAANLDRSQE